MDSDGTDNATGIAARLRQEMREYLYISLYLWVCFSALILYESAILQTEHANLVPLGSAAIKALILGKFILIGKAIKAGERMKPGFLLQRIALKSVAMLLVLIVLKALEEIVAGALHGHSVADVFAEFMARSWLQDVAPAVIMLLVLIPLIAWEEIDKALGKGRLRQLLLQRPQDR